MTILTEDENDLIEAYLTMAEHRLDDLGLSLHVGNDMEACRAAHATVPGALVYPMTHDPAHTYLHPDNSFWLAFMSGREVITIAARRVTRTESLVAEFYCHRGFANRAPVVHAYPIGLKSGLPKLSETFGNTGALAAHTNWQRLGLGGLIARVTQALSIRRFWIGYQHCLSVRDGRTLDVTVLIRPNAESFALVTSL